jgi:hypothetical protein
VLRPLLGWHEGGNGPSDWCQIDIGGDRSLVGLLDNAEPRTPESTTPTSFRQWSEDVLKPAVLA